MAPHNPQGPVSTAASLELGFATPSYIICETVHSDVPWRADVVREGFTVEKKGRIVRPNTRPGLGIEIDEDEVRRHPFQQEVLQRVFYKDGSVGDVRWDSPAFNAGIGTGTTIVAVNGQAYDKDVLEDAVKAAKTDKAPIELMVKEFDLYRTVKLDYHGGLRYPHLERIQGKPDLLTPILTARK